MCAHINMWCGFLLFTLISSVDLLLILFPPTSCGAFPSVIPSSLPLSPPSLPPALSLFLSDQVGLIRWFSVQGNRRLIRATSLRRRTTFSPFPEPFNDHGEVGPWEPFLSRDCYLLYSSGAGPLQDSNRTHLAQFTMLKLWSSVGTNVQQGCSVLKAVLLPTARLHDMGIFSFIFL